MRRHDIADGGWGLGEQMKLVELTVQMCVYTNPSMPISKDFYIYSCS